MHPSLAEQVLHILGFTIIRYCQREEQSKLITLFPFIMDRNPQLKWKLFTSQSLKHFIENKSIPTFIKTFNVDDDNATSNSVSENNNSEFPIYQPLSVTTFNIVGININDINSIYKHCDIKHITKSYNFQSFTSFVIMLVIESFYKQKFPSKIDTNTSIHFLDRDFVNEPTIDIIFNKNELKDKILNKFKKYDKFESEAKGEVLNLFKMNNETFDYMIRIIKERNNNYDLNWLKQELINIKLHNYDENDSFFNDIARRFTGNDNNSDLDSFCEMLNILFLVKMKLFNQWVFLHSEEVFLSEISAKSFMTMGVDIFAITPDFDKVVMVQGSLKQVSLTFDSCSVL
eukprot:140515_1